MRSLPMMPGCRTRRHYCWFTTVDSQWLEDTNDFALQVANERHSRGQLTIDDESQIWTRSLALVSNSSGLTASPDHF
jgi:hypothetical protein